MMDEVSIVMDSNEHEMIEVLKKLNISRPIAITLTCLVKCKGITSQKIEMVTGLRQPEVSVAMRYLKRNNWIEIREEKISEGKGRPTKLYSLIVPMNQIINVFEEKILEESSLVLRNIEALKQVSDS
jgi:predicted transcriptional regulator